MVGKQRGIAIPMETNQSSEKLKKSLSKIKQRCRVREQGISGVSHITSAHKKSNCEYVRTRSSRSKQIFEEGFETRYTFENMAATV